MGNKPSRIKSEDYKAWVVDLKSRLRSVQLKAAISVNSALLEFYWELGADIVEKQKNSTWGSGFLQQLSQDLMAEFPDMKGFSKRNLELIRRWHLFYTSTDAIAKQAVSQLSQIPWGHNIVLVSKCQSVKEALYYVEKTRLSGNSRGDTLHIVFIPFSILWNDLRRPFTTVVSWITQYASRSTFLIPEF